MQLCEGGVAKTTANVITVGISLKLSPMSWLKSERMLILKEIVPFPQVMASAKKARETVEVVMSKDNECTELRPCSQEVEKYFNEPLIPRKDDSLKYCRNHGAALYRYRQKCFAIPSHSCY